MAVKMFAPNYHDIPLFKGLGREEINEVLHKFHGLIKHFPKSDYIYLAGDCIENLCVVMEGTVQMIKEDIWGEKSIIANLSAGDVFAENYLGKLSDHSVVSYFAASDSEILMLPLGRMLFDGSNHNETNRRLMCNIVSILADNNTRLIAKRPCAVRLWRILSRKQGTMAVINLLFLLTVLIWLIIWMPTAVL